nr:YidC/Oxa1 family membrane protein insertase [uncultured Catonella sp.]
MIQQVFALTQYNGAIVGPIARVLAYIMNGIYAVFSAIGIENAAICILLFTFIMRALMMPMYYRQQKVGKLTSRMSPELQEISKKYKGKHDMESKKKMQQETQAVYEKYGSNPLSGCLPILITFPIMLGLYRIVQSMPAYMPAIRSLYESIATPIMEQQNYADIITKIADNNTVKLVTEGDKSVILNSVIDVLATFNHDKWEALKTSFSGISNVIAANSAEIEHINSIFGLFSISDVPGFTKPFTFIVPILAGVLQFINGKQITNNQPQTNTNDQAAAINKNMMNFMPFMQAFFCLTFPIGIGVYWIAGSIFMIIQQYFFNKLLENVDVDEMIRKNQEKAAKLRAKRGEAPVAEKFNQFANTSTRSIANTNTKKIDEDSSSETGKSTEKGITIKTKNNYKITDYKKREGEYKANNISDVANMLKRD